MLVYFPDKWLTYRSTFLPDNEDIWQKNATYLFSLWCMYGVRMYVTGSFYLATKLPRYLSTYLPINTPKETPNLCLYLYTYTYPPKDTYTWSTTPDNLPMYPPNDTYLIKHTWSSTCVPTYLLNHWSTSLDLTTHTRAVEGKLRWSRKVCRGHVNRPGTAGRAELTKLIKVGWVAAKHLQQTSEDGN